MIATVIKGTTYKQYKKFCKERGLCCRRTNDPLTYIVYHKPTPKCTKPETIEQNAKRMALYYIEHCPVSICFAKFELKRRQSRMTLQKLLYLTFLNDMKNGDNTFAMRIMDLSFYKSFSGKFPPFNDKIPYLDFVPNQA